MRKYTSRPVEVTAVIWEGNNRQEIWKLCTLCYFNTDLHTGDLKLMVQTEQGVVAAEIGDYIVRDHHANYSVFKPEEFKHAYNEVINKNQHNENS